MEQDSKSENINQIVTLDLHLDPPVKIELQGCRVTKDFFIGWHAGQLHIYSVLNSIILANDYPPSSDAELPTLLSGLGFPIPFRGSIAGQISVGWLLGNSGQQVMAEFLGHRRFFNCSAINWLVLDAVDNRQQYS